MTDFVANFDLQQNNLQADFGLENTEFDALFQINPAGAAWGSITGQISAQTDLQDALDNKQNTISDLETIRANAENGASAYSTISNYGDVVSYNASDFATSIQGGLADTAIQPNDDITELNNNAGYITNSALNGYATENFVTSQGYITGIESSDVINALGYTPYNSTNPAGYITAASLPTVNNATITIQKNGSTVESFTLNQASNKTVNITVPTTASDVGALPNSTNYGASIDLSLNTTDYKLTLTLKDQNGNTLNSKVVDFPLESVVVNGSYDNTSKKIILTLQNGNTVDIPVGDLVAGLQTEITSTNKLSADLVDDASTTNKFVTASDKTTWNGKQDAISDLSTIRSNATNGQSAYTTISNYGNIVTHNTSEFATSIQGGLADSALQPNDNVSDLVNDAGYITGVDSSDITTALGYTPADVDDLATVATSGSYNDLINKPSIPAAQIQSDWSQSDNTALDFIKNKPSLSNYVTLDGAQNITGTKTFVGQKKIAFKQSSSSDKLGFTLYNNSGTEKGYLEYNPSNTVDSVPLMTLGNYASASGGLTHVGFRKYDGANSSAYNLLTPLASDAKTPFSLSTTYTNFYMPLGFTNGNTTVKTAKSGVVDISTLLPTVPTNISSFTNDAGYITNSALTGFLQNTATGTNALTLLGTATNQSGSINIGYGSSVTNTNSVVMGASAQSAYAQTVAIGYQSNANDTSSTAVGYKAYTNYQQAAAYGYDAQATAAGTTAVGSNSRATVAQTAAFGYNAKANNYGSTALGYNAVASANYAIQIGNGTNSTASTLAVGFNGTNYQLLDGTTGLIPDARVSTNIARTSDIPASEIFIAEYNVTSYADVLSAYNSGKTIFCLYQYDTNNLAILTITGYATNSYGFSFVGWYANVKIYAYIGTDSSWINATHTVAINDLSNVSSINSSSAVATALNGKADTDLSNLSATGQAKFDSKVNNDDYYYKSGDTITNLTYWGGGVLTASGKEIDFNVPLPKSLKNITTITCTALSTGFRKTAGGYMPSSGGNGWNAKANGTVVISRESDNMISVSVTYSSYGGTNNTPVGVWAQISLSFT